LQDRARQRPPPRISSGASRSSRRNHEAHEGIEEHEANKEYEHFAWVDDETSPRAPPVNRRSTRALSTPMHPGHVGPMHSLGVPCPSCASCASCSSIPS
jgi:hypothetical protein